MSSERIARLQIVIRSDISDELKILLAQIAENIHRENMTILKQQSRINECLMPLKAILIRQLSC